MVGREVREYTNHTDSNIIGFDGGWVGFGGCWVGLAGGFVAW